MKRASVLGFEKLIQLWQAGCGDVSLCQLLGLASAATEPYPVRVLKGRFRETWWEVIWPHPGRRGILGRDVEYKYVADSFPDALRRCPDAALVLDVNLTGISAQQIRTLSLRLGEDTEIPPGVRSILRQVLTEELSLHLVEGDGSGDGEVYVVRPDAFSDD
jgi:hypothetical protein